MALNAEYEGRKACVLVIKYAEGFTYRYVLDLERGAMPASKFPNLIRTTSLISSHGIPTSPNAEHGLDFLKRIRYTPKTGGVNMITLTQVDITSIPTSNDFRLKFDEKYNVPDRMKWSIYRGIDEFSFRDDPRTAPEKSPPCSSPGFRHTPSRLTGGTAPAVP